MEGEREAEDMGAKQMVEETEVAGREAEGASLALQQEPREERGEREREGAKGARAVEVSLALQLELLEENEGKAVLQEVERGWIGRQVMAWQEVVERKRFDSHPSQGQEILESVLEAEG